MTSTPDIYDLSEHLPDKFIVLSPRWIHDVHKGQHVLCFNIQTFLFYWSHWFHLFPEHLYPVISLHIDCTQKMDTATQRHTCLLITCNDQTNKTLTKTEGQTSWTVFLHSAVKMFVSAAIPSTSLTWESMGTHQLTFFNILGCYLLLSPIIWCLIL